MESLGGAAQSQAEHPADPEAAMNSIKFLYAAYIATWMIHVFYIGTLIRRFSRLRREMKELGKGK